MGNFNQLKKLKAKYPNLKILVSIGGWTYSKYFSDAAATDAVAQEVRHLLHRHVHQGQPAGRRTASAAPARAPASSTASTSTGSTRAPPATPATTTAPPTSRTTPCCWPSSAAELDAFGSANGGKKMTLTAAVPAGQDKIAHDRDQQDRQLPRLRQRDDVRHARRVRADRPDQPAGPAVHLAERPDDPDPAGHRQVLDRRGGQGVDRWRLGLRHPRWLPGQQAHHRLPVLLPGLDRRAAGSNHGLYQTGQPTGGRARPVRQRRRRLLLQGAHRLRRQPGGHLLRHPGAGRVLLRRHHVLVGRQRAVDQGEGRLPALPRAGRRDDVLAGGAGPGATRSSTTSSTASTRTTPGCTGPSTPPTSTSPTPSKSPSASPSVSTSPSRSPSASPSTSPTSGCTGLAAWVAATAYNGGAVVSYGGHKWTAKWWTQGDIPGNNAQGVWTDNGACGGTTPPRPARRGSVPAWPPGSPGTPTSAVPR